MNERSRMGRIIDMLNDCRCVVKDLIVLRFAGPQWVIAAAKSGLSRAVWLPTPESTYNAH